MANSRPVSPVSDASSPSVSRVSSLRTQTSGASPSAVTDTRRRGSHDSATPQPVPAAPTQDPARPLIAQPPTSSTTTVNGSTSPPQPLKLLARSPTSKAFSRWNDWWIWEILAGILSILSLLSICIVLAIYDGKPQPQIQWGITLNAVIAFIATIMRAAFITLLAEGTSQLKWLAFAGDTRRPLHDFNVYDAASRGGFGSLQILWRLRRTFWRDLATVGAIFYILSIGVDTFVQQLIQTEYRDAEIGGSDVFLVRSERYDLYYQTADHQGTIVPDNLDSDMLAAVYSGLYATSSRPSQDLFSCPGGNCTFPLTPSLAICSQCKDLKADLINSDEEMNVWTLPRGPTIDQITLYNITATNDSSRTNTFQDEGAIITSFAYVNGTGTATNNINNRPDAWECVLKFCVQVYGAKVTSGVLEQRTVQTFDTMHKHAPIEDEVWPEYMYDYQIITDPALIPGPASRSTFNISAKALLGLQNRLPPLFSGDMTAGTHGLASGGVFSTDITQRMYFMYGTNITALTQYLASTMTASIRRNQARTQLFLGDPSNETAVAPPLIQANYPGTAFRTVPHVRVEWAWIALPAAGVFFANVFLAVAMWMTHSMRAKTGVGVWKSSQIPLLYHGLDVKSEVEMERLLGSHAHISDMEETSKTFEVRFERSAASAGDGGSGPLKLEMLSDKSFSR
jgi:hypothetical protein